MIVPLSRARDPAKTKRSWFSAYGWRLEFYHVRRNTFVISLRHTHKHLSSGRSRSRTFFVSFIYRVTVARRTFSYRKTSVGSICTVNMRIVIRETEVKEYSPFNKTRFLRTRRRIVLGREKPTGRFYFSLEIGDKNKRSRARGGRMGGTVIKTLIVSVILRRRRFAQRTRLAVRRKRSAGYPSVANTFRVI